MSQAKQYDEDRDRLAELLEQHTKIPRQRTINFIKQYGAEQMLPCANIICSTEAQRKKLIAVFELKNAYEKVKQGEKTKCYTLDSSNAAMEYFCNYFADIKDREHFAAAFLNNKHDVITTKTISTGSLNTSLVCPREILKEALFCNANGVIVSHNHPSGSLKPSPQDLDVIAELRKCFESTGVQVLDHILVAGDRAVSLDNTGHVYEKNTNMGVSKAASPVSEKSIEYKPPRIKEQLASAEKQIAAGGMTKTAEKKCHDRESR